MTGDKLNGSERELEVQGVCNSFCWVPEDLEVVEPESKDWARRAGREFGTEEWNMEAL